jgi:hypothetical protein
MPEHPSAEFMAELQRSQPIGRGIVAVSTPDPTGRTYEVYPDEVLNHETGLALVREIEVESDGEKFKIQRPPGPPRPLYGHIIDSGLNAAAQIKATGKLGTPQHLGHAVPIGRPVDAGQWSEQQQAPQQQAPQQQDATFYGRGPGGIPLHQAPPPGIPGDTVRQPQPGQPMQQQRSQQQQVARPGQQTQPSQVQQSASMPQVIEAGWVLDPTCPPQYAQDPVVQPYHGIELSATQIVLKFDRRYERPGFRAYFPKATSRPLGLFLPGHPQMFLVKPIFQTTVDHYQICVLSLEGIGGSAVQAASDENWQEPAPQPGSFDQQVPSSFADMAGATDPSGLAGQQGIFAPDGTPHLDTGLLNALQQGGPHGNGASQAGGHQAGGDAGPGGQLNQGWGFNQS